MKHFFSILIAGLFIGFIFTPPLITLVREDALVSEFEKRQLAKLPEVKFELQSLVKFPRQFEIYFNLFFSVQSYKFFIKKLIVIVIVLIIFKELIPNVKFYKLYRQYNFYFILPFKIIKEFQPRITKFNCGYKPKVIFLKYPYE